MLTAPRAAPGNRTRFPCLEDRCLTASACATWLLRSSRKTVGTAGFEPAISASQGRRRRPSSATFREVGTDAETSPVHLGVGEPPSGPSGTRTRDLPHAERALFRLSYRPICAAVDQPGFEPWNSSVRARRDSVVTIGPDARRGRAMRRPTSPDPRSAIPRT